MKTPKCNTPIAEAEAEGWVLVKAPLTIGGKGTKLVVTIPVETVRALEIIEGEDEVWAYHNPEERRIMYQVRKKTLKRKKV